MSESENYKIDFSVVVPVYNEEDSLEPLFKEIQLTFKNIAGVYEVVFVDDCSDDNSPKILKSMKEQFPQIVNVITLGQRSGQTFGLRKGLDESKGNIVFTLDADLQNDPADFPKLINKLKEGYHCACGWRKSRQDTMLKAGLSKFGNVLQRIFTGMVIHDVSCTLRAYNRECIKNIALNWEGQHRFIPLSLSLQGYKIGEVISNHRLRKFGYTKYSHKRIFRVIVDFFKVLAARGRR